MPCPLVDVGGNSGITEWNCGIWSLTHEQRPRPEATTPLNLSGRAQEEDWTLKLRTGKNDHRKKVASSQQE